MENKRLFQWTGSDALDQTAEWLAACEGVFTHAGPTMLGRSPAHEIWFGSTTLVSASSCQKVSLSRTPRPTDGRLLDHLGARFVLTGAMNVGEDGNLQLAGPGDCIFIDLSLPLRLEYVGTDEITSELTLWVPRSHPAVRSAVPGALHGRILRGSEPAGSVVSGSARALHAELPRLPPNDIDQLVGGLFGLVIARMPTPPDITGMTRTGLESLATICRFIETNLAASDLGVERLARTFGLSRASLYRLFEPVGGVASYVRARRLSRARQELLAAGFDNRRIGPIAYQSGFRSVTAFNRAFREVYGEAPRDARRNRANTPVSIPTDSANMGVLARALLAISA